MLYQELLPDPLLRSAIRCYWFMRGRCDLLEPERILPDGCSELIFHCGQPFRQIEPRELQQERLLLVGPSTRAFLVRPSHDVDVIGVRFRPGGATLLRCAPAAELRDRALYAPDAGVTLPAETLDLLNDLDNNAARARWLDRVLLQRLARTELDEPMLALQDCITRSGGTVRTRTLAGLAGLSVRQLQRRFLASTGVTTKLFSRLVRLQRALSATYVPNTTLAAVAAAAGYADQAHFSREFRDFAGVTPSEHFRGIRELADLFIADPRV